MMIFLAFNLVGSPRTISQQEKNYVYYLSASCKIVHSLFFKLSLRELRTEWRWLILLWCHFDVISSGKTSCATFILWIVSGHQRWCIDDDVMMIWCDYNMMILGSFISSSGHSMFLCMTVNCAGPSQRPFISIFYS